MEIVLRNEKFTFLKIDLWTMVYLICISMRYGLPEVIPEDAKLLGII